MKKVFFSSKKKNGALGEKSDAKEYMADMKRFGRYVQEELDQGFEGFALIGQHELYEVGATDEYTGVVLNVNNFNTENIFNPAFYFIEHEGLKDLEIGYDRKGNIEFRAWDEEGCERMKLYLLTADDMEFYLTPGSEMDDSDDLEAISSGCEPLNVKGNTLFEKHYPDDRFVSKKMLRKNEMER